MAQYLMKVNLAQLKKKMTNEEINGKYFNKM